LPIFETYLFDNMPFYTTAGAATPVIWPTRVNVLLNQTIWHQTLDYNRTGVPFSWSREIWFPYYKPYEVKAKNILYSGWLVDNTLYAVAEPFQVQIVYSFYYEKILRNA
jgi:hypothetical protein